MVYPYTTAPLGNWQNDYQRQYSQNQLQQPISGMNNYQQAAFSCRPVTSREEAIAVQVDFLSAGTIMPDLAHGMVYLKRFNPNTGASDFLEFKYQQPQEKQDEQDGGFVAAADFEALRSTVKELSEKVDKMQKAGIVE